MIESNTKESSDYHFFGNSNENYYLFLFIETLLLLRCFKDI